MVAAVATTPSVDGWQQQPAPLKSKHKRRNNSSPRSHRSLVSEVEQNSSSMAWGRSFRSLRVLSRSNSDRSSPSQPQHNSSELSGSRNQHEEEVFDAEVKTSGTSSCDSWYGTVAIGRDIISEPDVSLSPERRSKEIPRKLVEVPMTPPKPKKKTSKNGLSPKKRKGKQSLKLGLEGTPLNSPVLWGDYGLIHNLKEQKQYDTFHDPGSPGRTPGKRLKERLRPSQGLFDHIGDPSRSLRDTWSELLGSTHTEDSPQVRSVSSLSLEVTSDNSVGQIVPETPPLVSTHDEQSFLGRFHAAFPKRRESDNGGEDELDSVSKILFDDEASNNEYSDDADMGQQITNGERSERRLIRFADEQGLPIARIHVVGDEHDPYATSRIVVLFLDPAAKKFEFMQGEFSLQAGATVSALLRQLPDFATEQRFAEMEYVNLYGTSDGPRPFGLSNRLHELNLCKREVVVAVMKGASGEHLVNEAAPLLANTKIMIAVKKASRIGRGLKYIKSMQEMLTPQVVTDDVATTPTLSDHCSSSREKFEPEGQAESSTKAKPYSAPTITLYDSTQEEIPELNFFEDDFHDATDFGRGTEEEPRRVMRYLHAALWATIGIAYTITNSS